MVLRQQRARQQHLSAKRTEKFEIEPGGGASIWQQCSRAQQQLVEKRLHNATVLHDFFAYILLGDGGGVLAGLLSVGSGCWSGKSTSDHLVGV